MYSTFGSTDARGYRRARSAHSDQCVVAVCPSSSPAAASTNAPVQSETMRRPARPGQPQRVEHRRLAPRRNPGWAARRWSARRPARPVRAEPPSRIPPSVMTDGAGPQIEHRYSGPPDAVVMSVPKTSFAAASSNSVTPLTSQRSRRDAAGAAAAAAAALAVLSCTLSIMPLSRRRGQVKAGTMRGIRSDHRTSSAAPGPDDLLLGDPLGLRPSGPADRMRARVFGASLDTQLAAGVPPESSRLLAARAREIVTLPRRQALARDWEHLLRVARGATPGQARRVRVAPIVRESRPSGNWRNASPRHCLSERAAWPWRPSC